MYMAFLVCMYVCYLSTGYAVTCSQDTASSCHSGWPCLQVSKALVPGISVPSLSRSLGKLLPSIENGGSFCANSSLTSIRAPECQPAALTLSAKYAPSPSSPASLSHSRTSCSIHSLTSPWTLASDSKTSARALASSSSFGAFCMICRTQSCFLESNHTWRPYVYACGRRRPSPVKRS